MRNSNNENQNNEEEKNNDIYIMNQKKKEYLNQKKMENRLEIPKNENIFELHENNMNTEVEIYDIDMYQENIKPLLEGTNVYKRFSEKAVKTEYEEYDPIKNKNILPEAFDYALRKLYVNMKEKQFEFFTLEGIPKKEAVIKFDQIVGIKCSDNAKKIIKMKQSKIRTGNKVDFIARDNIPFSILTKNNNCDIVCPEYASYLAIKTMIESVLSQPKVKKNIFEDIEIDLEKSDKEQNDNNYEEYDD